MFGENEKIVGKSNISYMSSEKICKQIGLNLKRRRLKSNITLEMLSYATGVSISSLKRMESGQIGNLNSLIKVLQFLQISSLLLPITELENTIENRKRASGWVDE